MRIYFRLALIANLFAVSANAAVYKMGYRMNWIAIMAGIAGVAICMLTIRKYESRRHYRRRVYWG